MSEYIEVGQSLQFTDPNTPTRVGEIVENVSDIYNIPSPRLGMQVFVKSEKKSFVITSLKSKVIGGVDVPEAAVEAFEPAGAKSITWNNDNDPSDMDDFVVAGVYDIKGEHTRMDDNLPILNTGGGHTFNARLTVLDSSIPGSGNNDDKCITQVLSFSNRLGQGEGYIRTGKGSSLYNLTWEKWSTLQRNVNVGQVYSLDNLIDNGIYSGVYSDTITGPEGGPADVVETFVLIVINDYSVSGQTGLPRNIIQLKYAVDTLTGQSSVKKRVGTGNDSISWGDWEILNKDEITSMISAEIKKVTDGVDPKKIDSIKDIIAWIDAHGGEVTAIYNAINAESQRAQAAEVYLQNRMDVDKRESQTADTEIKANAMQYNTLGVSVYADKAEIYGRSIDGKPRTMDFPAATTEKAGVMSAEDKNILNTNTQELFPETLTPNFRDANLIASGNFNKWWGFSTVEDNVSGLLVAIDFGSAPASNKTWQYRLGKKVRDESGTITGLTTVQGSEGTIERRAGETRAYLTNPIRFETDYVLELYFTTITQDEDLRYRSAATDSYYIRFVDGIATSGSMYAINAVIKSDRSFLKELQDNIIELNEITVIKSRNLFDRSKVIPGYVNSVDGVVMTSSAYPKAMVSPVIDVEPNTYYSISGRTETRGIVGYDSNGNRIQIFEGSWATPNYNGAFLIPSNVVKIQFSCVLNHDFSESDLIQLEKGENITAYVPYYEQPVNEAVAELIQEQPNIRAELDETSIIATNVYDLVKTLNRNSEIISPDYKGATQPVSGNFNNWWGFSTVNDLSTDCFFTGITFSGSLSNDYTFKARISKKVRNEANVITGLQTVSDVFELTLKAGESRVDIPYLPFAADDVLEVEYNAVSAGLIKYTSGAADGVVWIKFKDQVVFPGSMWDVNINLLPISSANAEQSPTKTLKVLSIGNSFSQDAFGYVPYIFNKCCPDVNLTFGILYYGGASLENHYNFLVGENKEYTYHKSDKGGAWVNTSSYSIQDALADEDWDIIVLQQNGRNAGNYSTFQPYLNNIVDMVFSMVNKPVRFAWHMTEAYSNVLETSVEQFTSYCTATREVLDKTVVDLVFPSATGLQNARTTTLQTLGDAGNMMHTSNHTQEGIPCYCLALPNVIVLLELCGYKYKGIFGEDTIPTQNWITSINMPGQNGTSVGATIENCKIAQKCAIMAIKKPYDITDCSEI